MPKKNAALAAMAATPQVAPALDFSDFARQMQVASVGSPRQVKLLFATPYTEMVYNDDSGTEEPVERTREWKISMGVKGENAGRIAVGMAKYIRGAKGRFWGYIDPTESGPCPLKGPRAPEDVGAVLVDLANGRCPKDLF